MSNLRKHLVKHDIYLKADKFTVFESLKANVKSPAAAVAEANVSVLSLTASAKDVQHSLMNDEASTSSGNEEESCCER